MKVRTIRKTLNKKFDDFVNSIEDEEVKKLVEQNTIITGGCIASYLLQQEPNDYDMYFRNIETVRAVTNYFVGKFKIRDKDGDISPIEVEDSGERIKIRIKSAGIAGSDPDADESDLGVVNSEQGYEYFEIAGQDGTRAEEFLQSVTARRKTSKKYDPVFLTENCISLSGDIQLVIRFYGEPNQVHENYDYVHCTNYWTSWDRNVTLREEALECLLTKELRYIGSRYPICSLIRMRKFVKRGFSITGGQILKIANQISQLDLTDYYTLREQLIGMDVAYFAELLEILQERKENGKEIDETYIGIMIDEVLDG